MNLSIMLKPASSNCNLRCKYCFYNAEASCREMPSRGMMNEDTLRNVLIKAFDFVGTDHLMLSFQGGEPLLAGKEFFLNLQKLIKELNTKHARVNIGIQTNGTLIDDDWCRVFKNGGYLVGLSLDGDKIANKNRLDANGNEVFDRVIKSAKLLQKYGVNFNILTVLTKNVAKRINEIYSYFKKEHFKYLQFIPMLKPIRVDKNGKVINTINDEPFPNKEEDFCLSTDDYKEFLMNCFELYKNDFIKGHYVSIRQFDNFVRLAHFEEAEQCGMQGHCNHQFVIEGDGEVYPCDFYCIDQYDMGNIKDTDFYELSKHPIAIEFIKESLQVEDKCKVCKYYKLCGNGCKRERIDVDKCDAYKEFFSKNLVYMKNMS